MSDNHLPRRHRRVLCVASAVLVTTVTLVSGLTGATGTRGSQEPIEIAKIDHAGPVNFEKEVLPILRRKCLACHNATDAESELVLETPESILRGGSIGPAVVPKKSAESMLLKVAAHQEDPVMPPEDNDVGAANLTPQELGLLKLWIDQGATGEVASVSAPIEWQALPPGVNPIYSVALTDDAHYVAAGRANQIFVYHVPSQRAIGRLTDPDMLKSSAYDKPGVAHLDLIQSLAFHPNGQLLASGGYRTIKLWRRPTNVKLSELAGLTAASSMAQSQDGKWLAAGETGGAIKLTELATGKPGHVLRGHQGAVTGMRFSQNGQWLVSGSQDKTVRVWNVSNGQPHGEPLVTPSAIHDVELIAEDKQVVTAGEDKIIRIWARPEPKKDAPPKPAEGEEAAQQDADGEAEKQEPAEPAAPEPLKQLNGHTAAVTSLAVVPGAAQLVSGGKEGSMRLWDLAGAKQIREFRHGAPIAAVAVRPDGKRVASASENNTARLWDMTNGKQLAEMRGDFEAKVTVARQERAASLAKRNVDAGKKDLDAAKKRKESEEANAKKTQETLTKNQEELKKKTEEAKKPVADKEAADKVLVASKEAVPAAEKKAAEAAEAAKAATAAAGEAKNPVTAAVMAVATASKNVQQATAARDQAKQAADKDAENKDLAAALEAAQTKLQQAEQAKQTADESKTTADAALAAAETKRKEADAAKAQADKDLTAARNKLKQDEANVNRLAAPAQKAIDARNSAQRAVDAATRSVARAKQLVEKSGQEVAGVENTIKELEKRQADAQTALEQSKKHVTETEKPLAAVAFSKDGKILAAGGQSTVVATFDGETGAPLERFEGQGAALIGLAFNRSDDLLSLSADKCVLWDTFPAWQLERTIGGTDKDDLIDRVTALDFSSDGKLLASGSGEPSRSGQLKIWNVADGKLVREIPDAHSDTIFSLDFSREGTFLVSGAADRFIKVFEVSSGKFLSSFEGHTHHVLGVALSADERTLVSSGADKVVKIWDFRSGDQRRTIQGFKKEVTSIDFVSDGINIVLSCGDRSVQIKRSDNGGNVRSFGGATDFVYDTAISGDGKTIASGGHDSVLRVWKDDGKVLGSFEPPATSEKIGAK